MGDRKPQPANAKKPPTKKLAPVLEKRPQQHVGLRGDNDLKFLEQEASVVSSSVESRAKARERERLDTGLSAEARERGLARAASSVSAGQTEQPPAASAGPPRRDQKRKMSDHSGMRSGGSTGRSNDSSLDAFPKGGGDSWANLIPDAKVKRGVDDLVPKPGSSSASLTCFQQETRASSSRSPVEHGVPPGVPDDPAPYRTEPDRRSAGDPNLSAGASVSSSSSCAMTVLPPPRAAYREPACDPPSRRPTLMKSEKSSPRDVDLGAGPRSSPRGGPGGPLGGPGSSSTGHASSEGSAVNYVAGYDPSASSMGGSSGSTFGGTTTSSTDRSNRVPIRPAERAPPFFPPTSSSSNPNKLSFADYLEELQTNPKKAKTVPKEVLHRMDLLSHHSASSSTRDDDVETRDGSSPAEELISSSAGERAGVDPAVTRLPCELASPDGLWEKQPVRLELQGGCTASPRGAVSPPNAFPPMSPGLAAVAAADAVSKTRQLFERAVSLHQTPSGPPAAPAEPQTFNDANPPESAPGVPLRAVDQQQSDGKKNSASPRPRRTTKKRADQVLDQHRNSNHIFGPSNADTADEAPRSTGDVDARAPPPDHPGAAALWEAIDHQHVDLVQCYKKRHTQAQRLVRLWNDGHATRALDLLCHRGCDSALFCDFTRALLKNRLTRCLSLTMCARLLPHARDFLLLAKYPQFVTVGAQFVIAVLRHFTSVIVDVRGEFALAKKVDVAFEERFQKTTECLTTLIEIQNALSGCCHNEVEELGVLRSMLDDLVRRAG